MRCTKGQSGFHVIELEIWQFLDDLCRRKPGRQKVEHISHANAQPADAWPAAAKAGIRSNALFKVTHARQCAIKR